MSKCVCTICGKEAVPGNPLYPLPYYLYIHLSCKKKDKWISQKKT